MTPDDGDHTGEKKLRFIGDLIDDAIPEEDKPLIRAAGILRAGTPDLYAQFQESLGRMESVLQVPYGPFYRDDVHAAARILLSVFARNEKMAREADAVVQAAGYRLNKKGHLVSAEKVRGSPPQHFRDLVWRVFCRMYPDDKHGGDHRKSNAEGLEPVRALLAPYFPEAWVTIRRLRQAVDDRS